MERWARTPPASAGPAYIPGKRRTKLAEAQERFPPGTPIRFKSNGQPGRVERVTTTANTGDVTVIWRDDRGAGPYAHGPDALEPATSDSRSGGSRPDQSSDPKPTNGYNDPMQPPRSSAAATGKRVNVPDLPAGVEVYNEGKKDYDQTPLATIRTDGAPIGTLRKITSSNPVMARGGLMAVGSTKRTMWEARASESTRRQFGLDRYTSSATAPKKADAIRDLAAMVRSAAGR